MPARGDRDEVQVSPREGKQGRGSLETPANPSPFLWQPSALESTFMYIVSVCVYRERYRFLIQNSFLSAHANMRFVFPNLPPCIGGLHTEVLNTAIGNEKAGYHFAASPVRLASSQPGRKSHRPTAKQSDTCCSSQKVKPWATNSPHNVH